MIITIAENEAEFDLIGAWRIIAQILAKPDAVIGLSTGRTTGGMHGVVSGIFKQYPFDVSKITFFNVDELINLPREYGGSCYSVIKAQLADPLGIAEENFIMPPTLSKDFEMECLVFEKNLAARGGADLQMLGIGENGHIGINQPGTPFEGETRVTDLDPELEARIRRETTIPPGTVPGGLTRGIKNIMLTRRIILIAKGEHKANIIEKAVMGKVTPDVPASVLQLHPNCEVLLDKAAALRIAGKINK